MAVEGTAETFTYNFEYIILKFNFWRYLTLLERFDRIITIVQISLRESTIKKSVVVLKCTCQLTNTLKTDLDLSEIHSLRSVNRQKS